MKANTAGEHSIGEYIEKFSSPHVCRSGFFACAHTKCLSVSFRAVMTLAPHRTIRAGRDGRKRALARANGSKTKSGKNLVWLLEN